MKMLGTTPPRKLRFQARNIIQRCFELLPATILALVLLKGSRDLFRIEDVSVPATPLKQASDASQPLLPVQVHDSQWRFCDGATIERPCVFDLGLNKGQSSAFYLVDPATRVLAVEANPVLARAGNKRFEAPINEGRLKIVHAGIAERKGERLTFWVNTANDKFSSFFEDVGCRLPTNKYMKPGDHTYCRRIEVQTATCAQLVRTHGTPRYLKVDVEGMDKTCLRSLADLPLSERPQYVSKENVEPGDLEMFRKLGYNKFKAVNQALLEHKYINNPEMRGTSGPWGEDAVDAFVGKKWQTFKEMDSKMPLSKRAVMNGKEWRVWYDLHAAK